MTSHSERKGWEYPNPSINGGVSNIQRERSMRKDKSGSADESSKKEPKSEQTEVKSSSQGVPFPEKLNRMTWLQNKINELNMEMGRVEKRRNEYRDELFALRCFVRGKK